MRLSLAVAIVALAALTGCAVGPDFRQPAAPTTGAYTATPLPAETAAAPVGGGESQRFVAGQDITGQWWTLFHSTELDLLIRQALADNPTLAAAQATLRQAQETLRARAGSALYPRVDGNASVVRQEVSGASFGQPESGNSVFTLYNASVNVSYALDLAGGARRELEALRAQVDYQRFQLDGAWLTLTANLVTAAVQEGALRAQIKATREIVAAQEQQLALVEQQFQLGELPAPMSLPRRPNSPRPGRPCRRWKNSLLRPATSWLSWPASRPEKQPCYRSLNSPTSSFPGSCR